MCLRAVSSACIYNLIDAVQNGRHGIVRLKRLISLSLGNFSSRVGFVCNPTAAPWPTADSGCALVKTSASGPIPTSRYCDQRPSSSRVFLTRSDLLEPGTRSDRLSPMIWTQRDRIASALVGYPAALSSITRSSMDFAKVTPAALIA
jgi:hypothetical protein